MRHIIIFLLIVINFQCNKSQKKEQIATTIKHPIIENEYSDWHHAAPTDSLAGIAMDKAYEYVSNQKFKDDVIVALIDGQLDIYHEELRDAIYVNPNEIPNNNIDDDDNGYVDDIHGWNYLGLPDGGSIVTGNFQHIRVLRALQRKYSSKNLKSVILNKEDGTMLVDLLEDQEHSIEQGQTLIEWGEGIREKYRKAQEKYGQVFIDKAYTQNLIDTIVPKDDKEKDIISNIEYFLKYQISLEDINTIIEEGYEKKYVCNNLDYDPYLNIDPDPNNLSYNGYGNGHVGENPWKKKHATQVAGPMIAKRGNHIGIKGISNNIKLMVLATLPQGSSRDKDFINAVHYAVDNGARIINYSAGDYYLEHKKEFYGAIAYAHNNGVLFVASAGNANRNIDDPYYEYYPTGNSLEKGDRLNTFIKVGSINQEIGFNLKASSSSYGQKNVDLFAPGTDLKTTNASQNKYLSLGGTSLATSITSGVAAFIMSYYPGLSAAEVKDVLMRSSTKYDIEVEVRDGTVNFKELSRSGGVINAYNAIKMAGEISKNKK